MLIKKHPKLVKPESERENTLLKDASIMVDEIGGFSMKKRRKKGLQLCSNHIKKRSILATMFNFVTETTAHTYK